MIRKSLDHEQLELLFLVTLVSSDRAGISKLSCLKIQTMKQFTQNLANYSTEPKILRIATGGGPPSRAFI